MLRSFIGFATTGVVVIGADTLTADAEGAAIKAWGQALVHEVTHTTEGTGARGAMSQIMENMTVDTPNGKMRLSELAAEELIDRGYFGDDPDTARARVEELLSREEELREIFEGARVDNKTEVQYNRKRRKNPYKQIAKREYAILSSEVARKQSYYSANNLEVPRYDCGYTDGFFYVYENLSNLDFGVLKQIEIKPETQAFIDQVEGWIKKNGESDQNAKAVDRIIASIRNENRNDRSRVVDGEHGRANIGDDRVSGSEPRSNGGRDRRGGTSDQRDGRVKDSLKRGSNTVSADNVSTEQIEQDLTDLIRLDSERAAIMAEKILGDGHFIRRLVVEQGSVAEKILVKLTELKESLSRMTSKDAKSLHRAVVKAEGLYLKAVEEAGYRFEGGKFVGAEEEEEEKKVRYSLRKEFTAELEEWLKNTDPYKRQFDGGYFLVGKTSEPLKRIGVRDANIYWRKLKIQTIMDDHPAIDENTIKDIPSIVENPVIVMKSLTSDDSITMFGDIKVGESYVMVAVNLTPKPAGRMEAEFSLISSAYDRSKANAKSLIERSEILYVTKKDRADTLMMSLGVQFPSDQQAYDSTYGSIAYSDGKVNIKGKKISEILVDSKGKVKESRKAKSQTSGDLENPPTELTGAQRQIVAEHSRPKVYTKAEAVSVIDDIVKILEEVYNEEGGIGEASGFVALKKKTTEAATATLWKGFNKDMTSKERAAFANKLAEAIMKETSLVTVANDETLNEARAIVNVLRRYFRRLDLSGIAGEIKGVEKSKREEIK